VLSVTLSTPKELGGGGGPGTNPEQLFAVGYSGFGIEVTLTITVPGVEKATVEDLVAKAHIVCPYSNATKGNIPVTLKVA
jgi:organic hydroperoxide reductase OsmC/OhrA